MANDYKIRIDFSGLLMGLDQINSGIGQQIRAGIGMVAQKVHDEWADRVMKAPGIWHEDRKAYVQSIRWSYTGPFSAVVEASARVADQIENGRPARDLKRMLNTSMKVRVAQNGKNAGKRYLIIPFRHNVPAGDGHSSYARQMPPDIYAQARKLAPSKVTGSVMRPSGTGAMDPKTRGLYLVPRKTYAWGGRLPPGIAPKLKPHHTTDIYANMVRMNTSTGKGKSSAYLTFRIMGEWQTDKWIVQAKPGLFIARGVARDLQSDAEKILAAAVAYA